MEITVEYSPHDEGNAFTGTLTNLNNSNSNYTVWQFPFNDSKIEIPAVEGTVYCLSIYINYSNQSISELVLTNIYISNTIDSKKAVGKFKLQQERIQTKLSYLFFRYN